MKGCVIPTRDVLTDPVLVHRDAELNFGTAREIADQKAGERSAEPMLLACCSEKKPGWIVYAESRGGNITIDVNDEEYVFIYLDASK